MHSLSLLLVEKPAREGHSMQSVWNTFSEVARLAVSMPSHMSVVRGDALGKTKHTDRKKWVARQMRTENNLARVLGIFHVA